MGVRAFEKSDTTMNAAKAIIGTFKVRKQPTHSLSLNSSWTISGSMYVPCEATNERREDHSRWGDGGASCPAIRERLAAGEARRDVPGASSGVRELGCS